MQANEYAYAYPPHVNEHEELNVPVKARSISHTSLCQSEIMFHQYTQMANIFNLYLLNGVANTLLNTYLFFSHLFSG